MHLQVPSASTTELLSECTSEPSQASLNFMLRTHTSHAVRVAPTRRTRSSEARSVAHRSVPVRDLWS
eukprot:2257985-Rhodomonas_salina.2